MTRVEEQLEKIMAACEEMSEGGDLIRKSQIGYIKERLRHALFLYRDEQLARRQHQHQTKRSEHETI